MKILRDIVCSSTPFGEMYTSDDLTGKVITDGNKLEGIIGEDFKSYVVFGTIDDNEIKLIMSSNHDKELPKMYKGTINNKKYCGEKLVVNRFCEIPYEECQVALYNPDIYRDVSDDEIDDLEELINLRKRLFGEESKYLYDNYQEKESVLKHI